MSVSQPVASPRNEASRPSGNEGLQVRAAVTIQCSRRVPRHDERPELSAVACTKDLCAAYSSPSKAEAGSGCRVSDLGLVRFYVGVP